jgi:hypothetical protein
MVAQFGRLVYADFRERRNPGQGPYLCGGSRQGEPVLSFQRMPFMTARWSLHWPRFSPQLPGRGSLAPPGEQVQEELTVYKAKAGKCEACKLRP